MSSISFLHIADLHLDSPFSGLKQLPEQIFKRIQESTFKSFYNLIDLAINAQVDFVIIAGDLFDGEDHSIRAASRFRKQMQRLKEHDIHIYLIHGNHDHMGGNWNILEWPSNVHVFGQNVEVKQFLKEGKPLVNLYGFSYPQRAVTENMTHHYIKQDGTKFHIGILHGSIEGNLDHNHYAPFRLNELTSKGFDYWALGHIHKQQLLVDNPIILYPGNTQGRHRKESGEKGGFIVRMNEFGTDYQFYPTADVIWENVEISISELNNLTDLLDKCFTTIAETRHESAGTFLTIEITGTGPLHEKLLVIDRLDAVIVALIEGEQEQENFVWITKIKVTSLSFDRKNTITQQSPFLFDLISFIDTYQDTDDAVTALFTHSGARKFLEKFSMDEQLELIKEAEMLLLNDLYRKL